MLLIRKGHLTRSQNVDAHGPGEMSQWVKALTVLPDDQCQFQAPMYGDSQSLLTTVPDTPTCL